MKSVWLHHNLTCIGSFNVLVSQHLLSKTEEEFHENNWNNERFASVTFHFWDPIGLSHHPVGFYVSVALP